MYCTCGRNAVGKPSRFEPKLYSQRMESECVHSPYVVDVVYCLPMAFECVLLVLDFRCRIYVFYRDPSFDRGRGISCNQMSGRSMGARMICS